MGSWLSEVPKGAIGVPRNHPVVWMWKETAKRVSCCHACQSPIPKGTERYCMLTRFMWRNYARGGGSNHQRCYLHVECVAVAESGLIHKSCFDCQGQIEFNAPGGFKERNYFSPGGRMPYCRLCNECAESGRYRRCDNCGSFFAKNRVSRGMLLSVDSDEVRESWICDGCEEAEGIETVRSKRRAERIEREFEARYQTILHEISQKGIFG